MILVCITCAATTTLTSTLDGKQAACPGKVVTYICNVAQGFLIDWTAEPFIAESNRLQFSRSTPTEDRVIDCSGNSTVPCVDLDYRATLTSIGPVQNGFANMTSTFRFTASARVNGTVVQCRGSTATGAQMANSTLIVAGIVHADCVLCKAMMLWFHMSYFYPSISTLKLDYIYVVQCIANSQVSTVLQNTIFMETYFSSRRPPLSSPNSLLHCSAVWSGQCDPHSAVAAPTV